MTVKEYNECVDLYADSLYRFIKTDLHDDEMAHDIVQDTYEKLWRHVTEVEQESAKGWLFSTAYHGMIDVIRKKKLTQLTDSYDDDILKSESQYSDINDVLHKALTSLPEQQRTVLLLRDYEGYDYKEIGKITGLNESQVKVYIYRGRIAMKKYIGDIDKII